MESGNVSFSPSYSNANQAEWPAQPYIEAARREKAGIDLFCLPSNMGWALQGFVSSLQMLNFAFLKCNYPGVLLTPSESWLWESPSRTSWLCPRGAQAEFWFWRLSLREKSCKLRCSSQWAKAFDGSLTRLIITKKNSIDTKNSIFSFYSDTMMVRYRWNLWCHKGLHKISSRSTLRLLLEVIDIGISIICPLKDQWTQLSKTY